ncbi:MAG: reverse transcriptase family protein [Planctomycetes bacterium]|nr:reverse transcriptase family protein [Planctomycetota bacterium]
MTHKKFQVVCPSCSMVFEGSNVPGTRLRCPKCSAILIVAALADGGSAIPDSNPLADSKRRRVKGEEQSEPFYPSNFNIPHKQRAIEFLANWLDVDPLAIEMSLMKLETGSAYDSWQIPKGDTGKFRNIDSPCEELKLVQRRILDRLLYHIPVSNACHGFMPARSIVTGAKYHLESASEMLNLDLKDAFPSVKAIRVKHSLVRYLKTPMRRLGEYVPYHVLDDVIRVLIHLVTLNGCLPQGGPCSGWLLNVACIKMDKHIYALLSGFDLKLRYTRYADDLTISSPFEIPEDLRQKIQKVIAKSGFRVNPEKVSYLRKSAGDTLEVTGLILEKGMVRIPRAKLDVYRAALHNAAKIPKDELAQEKKREIQSMVAFVSMVYGDLPRKIYVPYCEYLAAHDLEFIGNKKKMQLDLYPH